MTPEEIRRRLPGAPEQAIEQLIALDKHHRELMARIKSSRDITDMLDYLEHMLGVIQRWNPTQLEPVVKEIVDTFGRAICKGDEACTRQFEQTLRKLVKLGDIK
jgi:hypothetical protein